MDIISLRLRVVPNSVPDENPNEFFVCVARNAVEPTHRAPYPQLYPARLEAFDHLSGRWVQVPVSRD